MGLGVTGFLGLMSSVVNAVASLRWPSRRRRNHLHRRGAGNGVHGTGVVVQTSARARVLQNTTPFQLEIPGGIIDAAIRNDIGEELFEALFGDLD